MPWNQVSGGLFRVTVGSATNVWGVCTRNDPFRYSTNDAAPWTAMPNPGVRLADMSGAADGTLWALGTERQVLRYNGTTALPWVKIQGSLVRIAVGSRTNVWGVDGSGAVFRYTNNDSDPWFKIPGNLSDIGAAADGTGYGIDAQNGQVLRYTGDQSGQPHWTAVEEKLRGISVGSSTNVWGVNDNKNVLVGTPMDRNQTFIIVEGSMTSVSTGADGTVFALDSDTHIFRWSRK